MTSSDVKKEKTKLMKSDRGNKGDNIDHMEDILIDKAMVHGIGEAVNCTDPETDKIDNWIYNRIVGSDNDDKD